MEVARNQLIQQFKTGLVEGTVFRQLQPLAWTEKTGTATGLAAWPTRQENIELTGLLMRN
jgi:hypothetical protein